MNANKPGPTHRRIKTTFTLEENRKMKSKDFD